MDYQESLRNTIPPHLMEGIDRWVEKRILPGGFLTAVLENDLKNAVSRADDISKKHIADIVTYLYNYVPSACWGSKEKVEEWAENI